jgi:diguanylate cyclase (GGDEF)-like protein/PAS domain S-box-containing protein
MYVEAEERQLEALNAYDLFGTQSEPEYDQFTELGAKLFAAPICLVSIAGAQEQWFKAHHGVATQSIPNAASFCSQMRSGGAPLIILDAAKDPVFSDSPLVTGEPHVRFYAGAPLVSPQGLHLGAYCVADTAPRDAFSAEEEWLLGHLAAMVAARMEKRRITRLVRAVQGFAGASSLAILTADHDGRITFWNRAAEDMFGRTAAEAIGRSLDILIPERFRAEHNAGMKRASAGRAAKLAGKTIEVVALRRNGDEFPAELTISDWQGARGREFGAQVQDISHRRRRELTLEHLAHHDPLTGLINRSAFTETLGACLHAQGAAALLVFDLDGFKSVNDTFGYPVGDALLQAIAIRLNATAEASGTLARLAGDAFALLMVGEQDPFAARETAQAMLAAFLEPFRIGGHVLQIGLSIGVAMAPTHAADSEGLLLRADLALLACKRAGGRQFRFFDTGMHNQLAARRAFKAELRRATAEGEWELFYQPQVRLADGALLGTEALLRWRHPSRGLLTPAAFLDVLETHPIAYEVGSWVIDEACRQLAAWRSAGWNVPRVSVNLFAAQFSAGTVEQVVSAALERHALHPGDLEIEVTETIALRPDDQIAAALHALREAGVHIAFDDFGTGFASLTTLKRVPVTRLKIDRSFVEDICEAPHSAAIVAAIVSLAERLKLEVVAEGIETEAQRAMLIGLGCTVGQGYLLGRPAEAGNGPAGRLLAA